MSVNYSSVYSTQPSSDFYVCHTQDMSLYAAHVYAFFESAVYACPTRVAVEVDDAAISYEILNGKVNLCANSYRSLGIEPGDVIVFSLQKSVSLLIAILAAIKIGAKICILPENISILRLRAIQRAVAIALIVHEQNQHSTLDVYGFHVQSISYQELMERSVYSVSPSFYANAFVSAGQVTVGFNSLKGGWSAIEFSQGNFLQMLHELDDVVPAHLSSERMLLMADITQPLFLLELFYVFMRQSTAVLSQNAHQSLAEYPIKLPLIGAVRLFLQKAGWIKPCLTGIELKGLCVSLEEVEYFAKQYPGVSSATASFSDKNLQLRIKFAWNFYPYPFPYSVSMKQARDIADMSRLAWRLYDFLCQHFWHALPLDLIVLEPDK